MRIINSKSLNASKFLEYNEDKVVYPDLETKQPRAIRLSSSISNSLKNVTHTKLLTKLTPTPYQKVKTKAKTHVIHFKVAIHPDDRLNAVGFQVAARRVLREFGLHLQPYIVYQHFDTKHPHIHIVVNRITEDGKAIPLDFDKIRQRELSRRLEEAFGLIRAEEQRINAKGERAERFYEPGNKAFEVSKKAQKLNIKANTLSYKNYLKESITQSLENKPDLKVFLKRLARRGVNVSFREYQPKGSKTKKIGISYSLSTDSRRFKIQQNPDQLLRLKENGYTIAPNGLPVSTKFQLDLPSDFKDFKVRASALGPAFQFKSINSQISQMQEDLKAKVVCKPEKEGHQYFNINNLIANESPSLSMLITSIETNNSRGIDQALLEGAQIEMISPEEKSKINPIYLAAAKLAEEENDLQLFNIAPQQHIAHQVKAEDLYATYEFVYGRQPSGSTKALVEAHLNNDFKGMEIALYDFRLHEGMADARILDNLDHSHLPENLKIRVENNIKTIESLKDTNPIFDTKENRDRKFATTLMHHAVRFRDHNEAETAYKTNAVDWKQFKKEDFAFMTDNYWKSLSDNILDQITKSEDKVYAESRQAAHEAIKTRNEGAFISIVRATPEILLEYTEKDLNFVKNEQNRIELKSILESITEGEKPSDQTDIDAFLKQFKTLPAQPNEDDEDDLGENRTKGKSR